MARLRTRNLRRRRAPWRSLMRQLRWLDAELPTAAALGKRHGLKIRDVACYVMGTPTKPAAIYYGPVGRWEACTVVTRLGVTPPVLEAR